MPFSLVAYFIVAAQVAADLRQSWATLGSLTMPLAFFAQFYASLRSVGGAAASPSNPLFSPHVMAVLLGFAAFSLAFCAAILYLVQARLLKTKQVRGVFRRLPPLESIAAAAHRLAIAGLSLLTLGMVTGAILAPQRWGAGWYLDPHTVVSVIAWAIYAAYLGASSLLGWRGRRTTYFLIAGFVVVLAAFVAFVARPTG
jgi:ABC-type uncharacterized transport system permease subunit